MTRKRSTAWLDTGHVLGRFPECVIDSNLPAVCPSLLLPCHACARHRHGGQEEVECRQAAVVALFFMGTRIGSRGGPQHRASRAEQLRDAWLGCRLAVHTWGALILRQIVEGDKSP